MVGVSATPSASSGRLKSFAIALQKYKNILYEI